MVSSGQCLFLCFSQRQGALGTYLLVAASVFMLDKGLSFQAGPRASVTLRVQVTSRFQSREITYSIWQTCQPFETQFGAV
jgi:hypothetical protein